MEEIENIIISEEYAHSLLNNYFSDEDTQEIFSIIKKQNDNFWGAIIILFSKIGKIKNKEKRKIEKNRLLNILRNKKSIEEISQIIQKKKEELELLC